MMRVEEMDKFNFSSKEPVDKGWSTDRKYRVVLPDGAVCLLRISPEGKFAQKKIEFEMMQRVAALGVPMCGAVAFGVCGEGVYSLQQWIDGTDAENVIPKLDGEKQYAYGLTAGRMLKTIHSIPAPEGQEDWATRFNRKIDRNIRLHRDCPVKFEGAERIIDYIQENRPLLQSRPQSFQHGDYHIGNMMLDQSGELTVIDFDRSDFGDPWEEFNRIVWSAQKAPRFAAGILDGYFPEGAPEAFFRLLALYISSNTLSSIPWAVPFGQAQIDVMTSQAREVLGWFDGMKNCVPSWYMRRD